MRILVYEYMWLQQHNNKLLKKQPLVIDNTILNWKPVSEFVAPRPLYLK